MFVCLCVPLVCRPVFHSLSSLFLILSRLFAFPPFFFDDTHTTKIDHGHTLGALEISPYKYEHSNEYNGKLMPTPPSSSTESSSSEPTPTQSSSSSYYSSNTPGRHIYKVPCPDTYRGIHRVQRRRRRRNHSDNDDDNDNNFADCDSTKEENEAGSKYAKYVQDACEYYTNVCGESVNAFIVEGGMSVAGVILPPSNYIETCVTAIRQAGGLYIADEVQTGFGRLGTCMWAYQYNNNNNNNNSPATGST